MSITWTNQRRKLSDLIPWPRNPRQIKGDQAKRLNDIANLQPMCWDCNRRKGDRT